MTTVAQYYASVGIQTDPKSLAGVTSYLGKLEKQIAGFQARISRQKALQLRLGIDSSDLARKLQLAVNKATSLRTGNAVSIKLNSFSVSQRALRTAIANALPKSGMQGSIPVGLRVSGASLSLMRSQIKAALEGTAINPRINARVNASVRGGARNTTGGGGYAGRNSTAFWGSADRGGRSHNPWHNPMMIGGGFGAALRFGAFSLPFVGGVYGLNAMNRFASEQVAQNTALDMVSDMSTLGVTGDQNRAFLRKLAQETGKTSMGMTPIYTQMLAASQGTELESKMPKMFSGIMKYASTMGLGEESIKRAMTGFQQMIGKRTIMAEELKGQVGEHIPTVIPLMAKAMGVDVKTLFKMMADGKLDPMEALPKLAALMEEMSGPAMAKYQQSLPYKQGRFQEQQQLLMQDINDRGGAAGLSSIWDTLRQVMSDSRDDAEWIGRYFERGAHALNAAMLLPTELKRWLNGETDVRNFWQDMFGDADSNPAVQSAMQVYKDMKIAFDSLNEAGDKFLKSFNSGAFSPSLTMWLQGIMESLASLARMMAAVVNGDFSGVSSAWADYQSRVATLVSERDTRQGAINSVVNDYGSVDAAPEGEVERRYQSLSKNPESFNTTEPVYERPTISFDVLRNQGLNAWVNNAGVMTNDWLREKFGLEARKYRDSSISPGNGPVLPGPIDIGGSSVDITNHNNYNIVVEGSNSDEATAKALVDALNSAQPTVPKVVQ